MQRAPTFLALVTTATLIYGCAASSKPTGHTTSETGNDTTAATPLQTAQAASGEASSPTATLSRSELIARADPICQRFNTRRESAKLGSIHSDRMLAPLVSYEWSRIAELTNLTPPRAMAVEWSQTLNDLRTIAETTATIATYASGEEARAIRSLLPTITEAERKLRALAGSDHLSACA